MPDTIDDLPANPQEALLGLIGSTFSELKRIDNHLVARNNYVAGIKTDLNQLVNEAAKLAAPVPQPQPVPQLAPQPVPVAQIQEVHPVQLAPVVVKQEEDDGQLLLDFYRKITPEDINSRLADIDVKLGKVIALLNELTNRK
jgi:hypothetical protein